MATEELNILIKGKDLFSKEIDRMGDKFKIASVSATAALSGVATTLAIIAKQTANVADELVRWNKVTGVSIKSLSQFRFMAQSIGIEFEDFADVLKETGVRAKEMQDGVGPLFDNFKHLGVAATTVTGELRATEDIFVDIVTALGKMENATLRGAIADEIFSDAGTKLIPILEQGAEGLAKMRKEADDLGVTMTELEAEQGRKLNENIAKLGATLGGMARVVGNLVIPTLNDLAEVMSEGTKEFLKWTGHILPTVSEINFQIAVTKQKIEELEQQFATGGVVGATAFIGLKDNIEAAKNELRALEEIRKQVVGDAGPGAPKDPTKPDGGPGGEAGPTQRELEAASLKDRLVLLEQETQWALHAVRLENEEVFQTFQQEAEDARINAILAGVNEEIALETKKANRIGRLAIDSFKHEERLRAASLRAEKILAKQKLQAVQTGGNAMLSTLESLNTLSEGKSRDLFNALKAGQIAMAIVDTYTGANKALAQLGAFGPPVAAAIITAGFLNVEAIRRQQFGGGYSSTGPSQVSVETPISLEPSTVEQTFGGSDIPDITGTDTTPQQTGPAVTINIINPMGDEDWDKIVEEEIAPALVRATDRNIQTS
jgi:hypothetical protein